MPFPLELKYIEIAEDQFGLKFPEKYKSKMQQENGGEFIESLFQKQQMTMK